MKELIFGRKYELTNKKSSFQMRVIYNGVFKVLSGNPSIRELEQTKGEYCFKVIDFRTNPNGWNLCDFLNDEKLRNSLEFDWSIFKTNQEPEIGINPTDLINYKIKMVR